MLSGLKKSLFFRNLTQVGRLLRFALTTVRVTWLAASQFHRDYCFERAAALSFASIISLIPLAVLVVGVSVLVGVGDTFIVYAREKLFPLFAPSFHEQLSEWLEANIAKNAFAQSLVGMVGLIAVVGLILAALGIFTAAERNFNRIWKVQGNRTYLQKLRTFWVILTASPFVMVASVWIEGFLQPQGGIINRLTEESLLLKGVYYFVMPTLIGFLGFTAILKYLPATRVRLRSALLGGIVVAILWQIAKESFSVYVDRSRSVSSFYGSLAVVPLFLIWVYVNWVIILWGCVLSYTHQNLEILLDLMGKDARTRRFPLHFVGYCLLEGVARAFLAGRRHGGVDQVSEDLCADTGVVEEAGRLLSQAGILIEDLKKPGSFALAKPPELITLSEVLAVLPWKDVPEDILASSRPAAGASPTECGAPLGTIRMFEAAQHACFDVLAHGTLASLLNVGRSASAKGSETPLREGFTAETQGRRR